MVFTIDDCFTPGYGWDDPDPDGDGRTTHWTTIVVQCEEKLGRKLTDVEITIISLSVDFGPTPSLTEEERKSLLLQVRAWRRKYGYKYVTVEPDFIRQMLSENGLESE